MSPGRAVDLLAELRRTDAKRCCRTPALAIVGLLVGFALNWIPPVPLSLRSTAACIRIKRSGDRLNFRSRNGGMRSGKRRTMLIPTNDPVYCFTAVFAPVTLRTTIYRRCFSTWMAANPMSMRTDSPSKSPEGRRGGYRAYTFKEGLDVGDWRVDVEAEDGRVIGRVSVKVTAEASEGPLALKTVVY
ncbi:MAG: DUF2914 domain-containing protein [Nitrospiraceae bacterium]